eukprot:251843-Rhodomonas_salina.1
MWAWRACARAKGTVWSRSRQGRVSYRLDGVCCCAVGRKAWVWAMGPGVGAGLRFDRLVALGSLLEW